MNVSLSNFVFSLSSSDYVAELQYRIWTWSIKRVLKNHQVRLLPRFLHFHFDSNFYNCAYCNKTFPLKMLNHFNFCNSYTKQFRASDLIKAQSHRKKYTGKNSAYIPMRRVRPILRSALQPKDARSVSYLFFKALKIEILFSPKVKDKIR